MVTDLEINEQNSTFPKESVKGRIKIWGFFTRDMHHHRRSEDHVVDILTSILYQAIPVEWFWTFLQTKFFGRQSEHLCGGVEQFNAKSMLFQEFRVLPRTTADVESPFATVFPTSKKVHEI